MSKIKSKLGFLSPSDVFTDKAKEDKEDWREDWKDMPEFIMNDLTPYKSLIIHFRNKEGIEEFSKIIDQKIIFSKSKSKYIKAIWYPKIKIKKLKDKLYVDDDNS